MLRRVEHESADQCARLHRPKYSRPSCDEGLPLDGLSNQKSAEKQRKLSIGKDGRQLSLSRRICPSATALLRHSALDQPTFGRLLTQLTEPYSLLALNGVYDSWRRVTILSGR